MATIVDKDDNRRPPARPSSASSSSWPRTLDAAAWDTPTCLPGWSVRDVFSHVIGAEAMLLGEPAPDVDLSHLTHMRNPIAEANEVWVEANRGPSGPEMVARIDDVTSRRLAELDAMDQAGFDAPSWTPAGRDETYGRFMRIRHFDCYLHEQDIRLALGIVGPRIGRGPRLVARRGGDRAGVHRRAQGRRCPTDPGCGST